MPNKIDIEEVKGKLPPFVRLYEETYRGMRYKAKFRDTEYEEDFEAIIYCIIKNQYGCPSRSNHRRSVGYSGSPDKIPLEVIKEKLPSNLEIFDETYRGKRAKAKFKDKETGEIFEANVHNVLQGKGLSLKRSRLETPKKFLKTIDQVQNKLDELYGGRVKIIPEEYINTNKITCWLVNGKRVRVSGSYMLSGKFFERQNLLRWRSYVNVRDNFLCQKCESSKDVCAHHILPYSRHRDQGLNIHNGLTLCNHCHGQYHALYKNTETVDNLVEFLDDEVLGRAIRDRLALPINLPKLP